METVFQTVKISVRTHQVVNKWMLMVVQPLSVMRTEMGMKEIWELEKTAMIPILP